MPLLSFPLAAALLPCVLSERVAVGAAPAAPRVISPNNKPPYKIIWPPLFVSENAFSY